MVNKIEQFLSEKFGEVRATKNGNILLFVAQDVARILGYRMASDMTRNLEKEDVHTQTLRTEAGDRDFSVITEGGLYDAVLSITKRNKERYELAREFKRWITNEVIPTLRETGAYIEEEREEEVIEKYFREFSDELKIEMLKELKKNNEKLKVKADKWDRFLETGGTYTFTEVAKMISTKATKDIGKEIKISNKGLTKYLRDKDILSKNKSGNKYTNVPNIKYEEYFNVTAVNTENGINTTQTKVKSKGVEFIYDILLLDEFQLNNT